jgi:hypothetical protein
MPASTASALQRFSTASPAAVAEPIGNGQDRPPPIGAQLLQEVERGGVDSPLQLGAANERPREGALRDLPDGLEILGEVQQQTAAAPERHHGLERPMYGTIGGEQPALLLHRRCKAEWRCSPNISSKT